jgi:hypothetical protein
MVLYAVGEAEVHSYRTEQAGRNNACLATCTHSGRGDRRWVAAAGRAVRVAAAAEGHGEACGPSVPVVGGILLNRFGDDAADTEWREDSHSKQD